jgi:HSP20 family protein
MKLNSIIPWKKEDRQLARPQLGNDPFALLQHRMNSLFDDLFSSQLPAAFRGNGFAPQIDLSETDKDVRITAELPGLDEKDVEVTLAENVLTLKGEKKEEHEEEKEDYYHSERSYGYFERSVQLPEGVDTDKAEAKFKKGVLKIAIPKKPGTPSSRRKLELQPG